MYMIDVDSSFAQKEPDNLFNEYVLCLNNGMEIQVKEYEEKGIKEDFEAVLANIKERDMIDSTRSESPLKKADDAVEIDTSFMTIEEVTDEITRLVKEKTGE